MVGGEFFFITRFWAGRKSTIWLVLETTLTKFFFLMFSNHPSLLLTSWCQVWNNRLLKRQSYWQETIITWPFKITFSVILMADIFLSVHYFMFCFISKTFVTQLLTTFPLPLVSGRQNVSSPGNEPSVESGAWNLKTTFCMLKPLDTDLFLFLPTWKCCQWNDHFLDKDGNHILRV